MTSKIKILNLLLTASLAGLLTGCQTFQDLPKTFGYQTYWGWFCGCTTERAVVPQKDEQEASDYLDKVYTKVRNEYEEQDRILEETANSFRALGFKMEKVKNPSGQTVALRGSLDGDIGFATGSAKLTPAALEIVDKFGQALKENPDTLARVHGHTDSVGRKASNYKLSQARAESVTDAMVKRKGVARSRIIEVKGFADDRKVVDTMKAEPRNRRTEILVEYKK